MDVGTILAQKYRLARPIGRGGMGDVFEGTHVATGKRVAIKVMHAVPVGKGGEDEQARVARFEREAFAVGRLETQHVAMVFDTGVDEVSGAPFIVMEYLDGEDLSRLIRQNGPLRVDLSLAVVAQACAGLAKAHEAGIIHRDIKPGNLFLSRNEYGERIVKVLDFGIAKMRSVDAAIGSEVGTLTETGALIGSPHYMSPEQAKGLRNVDHRADIWSLGVVLHKCLSGRTPFDGASTLGQVIIAVCSEDPVSVEEHAPWVPPVVGQIVRAALQRDPAHRFQSVLEMLEALRPLLPNGPRITDEMLAPLPEEVRALGPAPPPAGVGSLTPEIGVAAVGLSPGSISFPPHASRPPAPASIGSNELSRAAFAAPPAIATPPKSRNLPIVMASAATLSVLALAGGIAVHTMKRGHVAPSTALTQDVRPPATSASASASASASSVGPVSSAGVAASTPVPEQGLEPQPAPAAPPSSVAAAKPAHAPTPRPATAPRPTATATASTQPKRLSGGVGSDVPF